MPYQTSSLEEALRRIRSEIDQLPDVVAMIVDEPLQVRDLWHWQVESLLERVRVLSQQGCAGLMPEEQQREYSAMVRQLDGARTWIEALGWTVPSELGQSIEGVGQLGQRQTARRQFSRDKSTVNHIHSGSLA